MKKRKISIPFHHENLELKQSLVAYARQLKVKEDPEGPLAASLIYASFAEYLALHLLENLRHIVYQSTFNSFAGIVYIDQSGKGDRMTPGKIIDELRYFSFPGKEEILSILADISQSRNELMHNLATVTAENIDQVDENIKIVADLTEQLIEKIEVVYIGLQKIFVPQDISDSTKETTEN